MTDLSSERGQEISVAMLDGADDMNVDHAELLFALSITAASTIATLEPALHQQAAAAFIEQFRQSMKDAVRKRPE